MDAIALRLDRLAAIARSVAESGRGLALLALGSAAETGRLDRWSDLDFFAVVQPGAKRDFVENLDWLSRPRPLAWGFRNTADGWKALYDDGVFVEFAVFEPQELSTIPFAPGRVVWAADGFDTGLCVPAERHLPRPAEEDWLMGEALSNLFVGLGRWRRGERLAGFKMVQVYALDHVLKLADRRFPGPGADLFNSDRRFEARHPDLAAESAGWAPGVERTPDAARAMLAFLERHFAVNPAIAAAIRELAAD